MFDFPFYFVLDSSCGWHWHILPLVSVKTESQTGPGQSITSNNWVTRDTAHTSWVRIKRIKKKKMFLLKLEERRCILICPSSNMSIHIIGLFYNRPARNKLFWNLMIKIVSMDLSVHPDSNDVKISHKIFELGFHSSSQEFKLNICQILMRSYYDRKKLLKFNGYYVVENVLHLMHVLSNNFLPIWNVAFGWWSDP